MTRRTKLTSIALLIGLVVLGVFYYSLSTRAIDNIILGVPYFGTFSGTPLAYDVESTAAMILRYWGDKRLSFLDLKRTLPAETTRGNFTFTDFKRFFESQGYEAKIVTLQNQRGLRNFLNQSSSTPIIVSIMNGSPSLRPGGGYYGVIVGSLESQKQIIVHQTSLGSNYLIPSGRFFPHPVMGLVVTPSAQIRSLIVGPDHSKPYPARLSIMDDTDIKNTLAKWNEALSSENDTINIRGAKINPDITQRLLKKWMDVINSLGFQKLHPAARILANTSASMYLTALKQYKEAISQLENNVIPIDHDLNEPAEGWPRDPTMLKAFASPWRVLALAYFETGEKKKAQAALENAAKTGDSWVSLYLEKELVTSELVKYK
ncbi:MAG: hypothetical protein HY220_02745 [Candidatus Sungbacteria bacterium]|uniref:Uncharacterized protein n=1 Tax=Candidatus Sungiibacteriota bacterium TaxID=2750080 RepID=A0A9D6QS35_9BACT|nr:hypothetical protein [Candidatus Sungbacteria bacterium]